MNSLARTIEIDELVNDLSTQDRILQLDAFLINAPQVDCPLTHKFAPGLYLREIFVPAGTLFTTYVHKTEHPYFGSMGELLIWEEGKGWQYVVCPCTGLTLAGTKRIAYAISDVIWTTVHLNHDDCRDIDVIEDRILEKYENPHVDLQLFNERKKVFLKEIKQD